MLPITRFFAGWRAWPERFGRVTAGSTYVPQIDGLRFLAIMQVVAYHAALRGQRAVDANTHPSDGFFAYFPNGVAGVELFFFISGYIIAFPFLLGKKPSLTSFYKRRLTRLEPPYMLTVLLCGLAFWWMAGDVGPAPAHIGRAEELPIWQSVAASMLYLHGLLFHSSPVFNPPLWSLEIEIQFYVLAPILLMAYLRLRSRPVRLWLGMIAVLAALAMQAYLGAIAAWHYTLLAHLYPFLLGIVVCDWAVAAKPFQQAAKPVMDFALGAGLILFLGSSLFFYSADGPMERGAILALRAISFVLIYLGASLGPVGRKVFGNRWLALIGGACYSIYLLHVPALQFLTKMLMGPFDFAGQPAVATLLVFAIIVPIVLAGSMIFYVMVERPCMNADWPKRLLGWVFKKRVPA